VIAAVDASAATLEIGDTLRNSTATEESNIVVRNTTHIFLPRFPFVFSIFSPSK
jgi:hypothetical protein